MNFLVWRLKIDAGGVGGHVGRHQNPSPGNDGSQSLTGEGLLLKPGSPDVGILHRRMHPEDRIAGGICDEGNIEREVTPAEKKGCCENRRGGHQTRRAENHGVRGCGPRRCHSFS